jgi:hypothetical protein
LLGALPADEDPVHVLQENGNPPMFDFFGLGQQGQAPQFQANNSVWGDNCNGE